MLTRASSVSGFGFSNYASWCTRKVSRKWRLAQSMTIVNKTQRSASSDSSSAITDSVPLPSLDTSTSTVAKGGFAKAIAKIEGHENFPKTIRFSALIQMGDPQGKIVEGTVVHVVDDDLYIDFGAKFNCVCPRPEKNGSAYVVGKRVRLMIHDLELSTRFLGAKSDLTILEADCSLLGLSRLNL